jgi:hypothetical protein
VFNTYLWNRRAHKGATKRNNPNQSSRKRKKELSKNTSLGQAPMACTYNPCYSGGRDQEDHGSKPPASSS